MNLEKRRHKCLRLIENMLCNYSTICSFLFQETLQKINQSEFDIYLLNISASTTLSQIKYGEQRNKKTSGERVSSGCQLNLVRLKKFVQVSERTGFCVDTENAAV